MPKSRNRINPPVPGTALTIVKPFVDETKAAKFKRLANGRVADAISAIERLGNLASPAYEYTDEQIATIVSAINAAMNKTVALLRARNRKGHHRMPVL